jgi:hypothetical protein
MMRVLMLFVILAAFGLVAIAVRQRLRPETGLSQDLMAAERLAEAVARRVLEDPLQLVDPGPLSLHHRDVPELFDCQACHDFTSDLPDAKCLECHEDVDAQLVARTGHHGVNLRGRCADCHAEHGEQLIEFNESGFQHDQALFALRGAHVELECAGCHRAAEVADGRHIRMNYIGLKHESCTDCHESPHADGVTDPDCTSCHITRGWGGPDLRFDHDTQSDFHLDATHEAVACGECHETQVFTEPDTDCVSCHADQDGYLRGEVVLAGAVQSWAPSPHAGLVTCQDCHDTTTPPRGTTGYAETCAGCHTPLLVQLYFDRDAHLRGLLMEGRRLASTDSQRLLIDLVERVGSHNYVPAEQHASRLLEELRP